MWERHYVKEMEVRRGESRLRTLGEMEEKEEEKSIPSRRIANQNFIVVINYLGSGNWAPGHPLSRMDMNFAQPLLGQWVFTA